ncbi:unnamed protein product [Gemmataceae bacterium]|nr:unnamed protein product [Gemmataceae bacterium]VTT98446.1 unnamed protein product [Gemmataceae bacterium]
MPTFLSDPPQTAYLLLFAAALVSGAVWFNRRDNRRALVVFGCVAGVLAVLFVLDKLFESPREESVRAVQAMVRAADTRDVSAFVANLADTLEYTGESAPVTVTREQVRNGGFWNVLRQHNVHVAAWDFSRDDVRETDANTIEIGFLAKGEANGQQAPLYFRATFARQPDGLMKLTRLATFDPMKRTNERKSIPFFP